MDIYLEAAKIVDATEDCPSCGAIWFAGKSFVDYFRARTAYSQLFTPSYGTDPNSIWGRQWGSNKKQCRVLALLFAHAMSETGDL